MSESSNIQQISLSDLRQRVGLITQNVHIFQGTVRDNLTFWDTTIQDDELWPVLTKLGLAIWLNKLPQGLDTPLESGGNNLSAGERQLLALARLFLRDPAIVILDEATASIDPLAEAQIQESLDLILAQRTAIVIAHRLSTIKHADRIIVLQQGAIIEQGNHDQLMAQGGHYAELYNTYFRGARLL